MFTSVLLTWSPPPEPNGVIIAYEVAYHINGISPMAANTTGTRLVVELVLNLGIFDVTVSAYNSIGPGNASMVEDVIIPIIPLPRELLPCAKLHALAIYMLQLL